MEEKVKAIVISSKDFKEKDKQIVLFSLEKGKVTAFLKGVKGANAKLKFAKELFCFGDYVLTESKVGKIVTSCEPIDMFYDITQNYENFSQGALILDVLNTVVNFNETNTALFINTLKALKILAYEKVNPHYVSLKFLIGIFEALGYKLSLNKCCCCGGLFVNRRFLCLETGEITCLGCKSPQSIEISNSVHTALRILSTTDYEKLSTIKLVSGSEKEALFLLVQNFEQRFSKKLKIF